MTLDARIADLAQKRLEGLMRRAQLADALAGMQHQMAEQDKQLFALDGALEVLYALRTEEKSGPRLVEAG